MGQGNKVRFSAAQLEEIEQLFAEGRSVDVIADLFDVSPPTIRGRLQARGIDTSRGRGKRKRCPSCGRSKVVAEFHKNSSYADGFSRCCRLCENERIRKNRIRRGYSHTHERRSGPDDVERERKQRREEQRRAAKEDQEIARILRSHREDVRS